MVLHPPFKSDTKRGITYDVDVNIGTCSCPEGQDGSPCSHQAAIFLHFDCISVNFIPTTPQGKMALAYIAYGENAVSDLSFYTTLTQLSPISQTEATTTDMDAQPDFSASCWDHICMTSTKENIEPASTEEIPTTEDGLQHKIDLIAHDIKKRLEADEIFKQSISKFVLTYNNLSSKSTNAYLTSAFHKFGWCFGGSITCQQGGTLRRGRRIP